MLQIIVILLVAYLLVPLADLTLNERVRYGVKLILYLLAALWVIWTLVVAKGGVL
jgi:hypothetical protein